MNCAKKPLLVCTLTFPVEANKFLDARQICFRKIDTFLSTIFIFQQGKVKFGPVSPRNFLVPYVGLSWSQTPSVIAGKIGKSDF